MQSITFTPIELLQYGGWTALCLGITMLIYWFRSACKETAVPLSGMIAGWTGLFLVVVGCISFPVRYTMEGHIAHETALAELPVEWQNFCKGLEGIDSGLYPAAVSQFLDTKPPKLTPDNYATVIGEKLWCPGFADSLPHLRWLRYSPELKTMVDFSFVGGQE